jgi:hypothetical protein
MSRGWLTGLLSVALVSVGSHGHASDPYCQTFAAKLDPALLYAVKEGCFDRACITTFDAPTTGEEGNGSLGKGAHYRFIYVIGNSTITKSPFIVKAMYTDQTAPGIVAKPSVNLARDRLRFACRPGWLWAVNGSHKRYEAPPLPSDWEATGHRVEIPYDKYDQYHRRGYTDPDNLSQLDQFHVGYENASTCSFTNDSARRPYFLFTDQEKLSNFIDRLVARFNAAPVTQLIAGGAEYRKVTSYTRLELTMSNYEKEAQTRGCISFPVEGAHDAVDLQLVDLEWQLRGTRDAPPRWHIQFLSNGQ